MDYVQYSELREDELAHFKYIRRYRSGGRWRYVYADKNVHGTIGRTISGANNSASDAAKYYSKADKYLDKVQKEPGGFKNRENSKNYEIAQQYIGAGSEEEFRSIRLREAGDDLITKYSVSKQVSDFINKNLKKKIKLSA